MRSSTNALATAHVWHPERAQQRVVVAVYMSHLPPYSAASTITARLGAAFRGSQVAARIGGQSLGFGRRQTSAQIPALFPASLSLFICRTGTVQLTLKSCQEPQVRKQVKSTNACTWYTLGAHN